MKNNNELIESFTKDVNKLQSKIEHKKLYNIRNFVVRALLKSGIAVDYALPFILAAVIIGSAKTSAGNAPFRIDEITKNANIETIDTSSGMHVEHISYDFNYAAEAIEYSTGWIVNDNGLYERTSTTYRLNNAIDLNDLDKVLAMSKEEIDNALVITNIKTIKKNTLDSEDSIYNSDAIIVTNHLESTEKTFTRLETKGENIAQSIAYIILSLMWGNSIRTVGNVLIKTPLRDRLRGCEPSFAYLSEEELKKMRNILKLKQENLALLTNESKNIDGERKYPRKLRKV